MSFLAAVGRPLVAVARYAVGLAALLGCAIPATLRGLGRPAVRSVLFRQIFFTGVEAVPLAMLMALAAAMALSVLSSFLGGVSLAGDFLVVIAFREIGPIAAATIVVARSATAVAAELGGMRVLGEIDGLEGMGIDPLEYLVAPRMAGAAVALAALTVFVVAGTVAAASLLGAMLQGRSAAELLTSSLRSIGGVDLVSVVLKGAVPGGVVAAVACREGLSVGTATDVPRAVRRAAVRGLVGVMAWNLLVTGLLPRR
ncbi:MAG TPA: ABC transporter permease [Anaeromyxobacter sp.]|nr:ABC transporter permease [Anaeromyxobacter sp.]